MRFDPKVKQQIKKAYPELSNYNELSSEIPGIDTDKLIRMFIYLIDKDSPIWKLTDISLRYQKAAELAGLKVKETMWQKIMEGENQKANEMLFVFFGIYHNPMFELWFTAKISLHYQMRTLRSQPKDLNSKQFADEAKVRGDVFEKLKDQTINLMKLEGNLFNDDRVKDMLVKAAVVKMRTHAEQFAMENSVI
jgi:hypothetical protein